ncbi:VanZ family protein [Amycolatopsis sp.]|uniref:VanZ family protein n=1 Tax=Amycolatopsis sp. TaxID=37632 RepID=UPI002E005CBD|nr:VanZ family protein [Amycolatopsis sp.]
MGDLLRNFGAMIPLTVIAFPYALLIWPLLAAQRRRKHPARTAVFTAAVDVTILLIAGLALCLVLMPVAGARTSMLHLVPGTDIRTALGDDGSFWQVGGNLLMLSPLGALLPMRTPFLRSLIRITLAALIVSMLVEGVQYLIHAGRVTATDDVLLNTLGATVGATATKKWWLWSPRILPAPLPIPAQRRRLTVCENPTLTQPRQPHLRPQPWQHPAHTHNAS